MPLSVEHLEDMLRQAKKAEEISRLWLEARDNGKAIFSLCIEMEGKPEEIRLARSHAMTALKAQYDQQREELKNRGVDIPAIDGSSST